MIVSIHQPEHLPYLGFFNKMSRCDKYVILDDVQYTKNNFQNRNKIISKNNQEIWLTVPVSIKNHTKKTIKDIKVANVGNWQKKYLKTIEQVYSKHKYFELYIDEIKGIICKDYTYLIDLNMDFICFFRNIFNISNELLFSSTLDINSFKSDRIVDICRVLDATVYLSGNGAKGYLNKDLFENENIKLVFQDYQHPTYESKNFMPYLSSIDLAMNCGPGSEKIIKNFK